MDTRTKTQAKVAAQRLMQQGELVNTLFDYLTEVTVEEWKSTAADDVKQRELLFNQLQAAGTLKALIVNLADEAQD